MHNIEFENCIPRERVCSTRVQLECKIDITEPRENTSY